MTKLIRHAAFVQRLDHSHTCYATNRHWPGMRALVGWTRDKRVVAFGTRDRKRGARLQGGPFDQSPQQVDLLRLAHAVAENAALHDEVNALHALKASMEEPTP
jgi:hypothetical protein